MIFLYSGQLQLTQDKLHREEERAHHLEGMKALCVHANAHTHVPQRGNNFSVLWVMYTFTLIGLLFVYI